MWSQIQMRCLLSQKHSIGAYIKGRKGPKQLNCHIGGMVRLYVMIWMSHVQGRKGPKKISYGRYGEPVCTRNDLNVVCTELTVQTRRKTRLNFKMSTQKINVKKYIQSVSIDAWWWGVIIFIGQFLFWNGNTSICIYKNNVILKFWSIKI
jgi:hypothetical protein